MSEDKPRLLIVDDEESIRSALRRTLRRDYEIQLAASGPEALELLKSFRPDVILSDHLMPEMTGLELVKRCRLLYPEISRVVLTGQAEMDTVIAAINEGAVFRFLTKPWEESELELTLHLAVEATQEARSQREESEGESPRGERQTKAISELERAHPGLTQLDRNADGAIIINED